MIGDLIERWLLILSSLRRADDQESLPALFLLTAVKPLAALQSALRFDGVKLCGAGIPDG